LALIDAPSVTVYPGAQSITFMAKLLSDRAPGRIWRWLAKLEKASLLTPFGICKHVGKGLVHAMHPPLPSLTSMSILTSISMFEAAVARYRPEPLDVPCIYYSGDFRGGGWRRLLRDLEVITIPGGHYGGLTTHVAELSRHLKSKMQLPFEATSQGAQPLGSDRDQSQSD
jgi:hypothetical protein